MKKITFILDKVVNAGAALSGVIIFVMTLAISYETIMRYFFNKSLLGINELTCYGLLWFTMLGSAWVLRNDKHIRIDVVLAFIKGRPKIILQIVISIICIIAMAMLTYYSGKEVYKEYLKHSYMYSVLELPKYLVMLIMPVGFCMLVYEFVRKLSRFITILNDKSQWD